MPELSQSLLQIAASRMGQEVWCIHPPAVESYIAKLTQTAPVALSPAERSVTKGANGVTGIAELRVEGLLVPRAEWYGEVGSLDLAEAFTALQNNDNCQAIIMRVNSPGGMARGMHEVVSAAREFASKKPLITHVEGVCASAAYELAAQSHKIYAGPRDDIGSIGTRSMVYDWSRWFADAGVEAVVADTGPIKSFGVMGTKVTDEQRAFMRERVDYFQNDFREAVMSGRGMTAEKFALVATGAWWFGEQALGLGLIDGVQNLQTTVAGVASANPPSPTTGSKKMADAPKDTQTNEPKPATTAEIKAAFPNSTADFREGMTESANTMADVAIAYAKLQEEDAQKARAEAEEAKKLAEEAANRPGKSTRGVPAGSTVNGDEEANGEVNFQAEVAALVKDHGCSRREAMRRVKRKHGAPAAKAFMLGQLDG